MVGGEWIPVDQLAPSRLRPDAPEFRVSGTREFVSNTLPRHWPYARDWDKQGKPRFNGARDVREALARSRDTESDRQEYD